MEKFTYRDYMSFKVEKNRNFFTILKARNLFYGKEEEANILYENEAGYNTGMVDINYRSEDIYKMLLLNKNEVLILINQILEFNNIENEFTEENIELCDNRFIFDDVSNKELDVVYKFTNENTFFLIEYLDNIDYAMPFRLLQYCIFIMDKALENNEQTKKLTQMPKIYPIVLYTGKKQWDDVKYLKRCQEEFPGYVEEPFSKYNLIDINQFNEKELIQKDGLFFKIMLLEKSNSEKSFLKNLETVINENFSVEQVEILKKVLNNILKEKLESKEVKTIFEKMEKNFRN